MPQPVQNRVTHHLTMHECGPARVQTGNSPILSDRNTDLSAELTCHPFFWRGSNSCGALSDRAATIAVDVAIQFFIAGPMYLASPAITTTSLCSRACHR